MRLVEDSEHDPFEPTPAEKPRFFVLAFLDGPMRGQLQFERLSPMARTFIVEGHDPDPAVKPIVPTYSASGRLKPNFHADFAALAMGPPPIQLRRAEYFPIQWTHPLEIPGTDRIWECSLWMCEADRHLFSEEDAKKAFDFVVRSVLRVAGPAIEEGQRKQRRARRQR